MKLLNPTRREIHVQCTQHPKSGRSPHAIEGLGRNSFTSINLRTFILSREPSQRRKNLVFAVHEV
eukprot:1323272-Amorphochlora_amoeboformis.AAC.2